MPQWPAEQHSAHMPQWPAEQHSAHMPQAHCALAASPNTTYCRDSTGVSCHQVKSMQINQQHRAALHYCSQ